MCGTNGDTNLDWHSTLPQVEGDYIWIEQFSCGCIVKSGIAWVSECSEEGETSSYRYQNDKGDWMSISWEGQDQPFHNQNGTPCPDFWARVVLPHPDC